MIELRQTAIGLVAAFTLGAAAQAEASDPFAFFKEEDEIGQRIVLDLDEGVSASGQGAPVADALICDHCLLGKESATRRLNAQERRTYGQWRNEDSVGYSVDMGGMEIGLWGDVREVNNAANADEGIVPSLSRSSAGSGTAGGPLIGLPGGALTSGAGVGLAPNGGFVTSSGSPGSGRTAFSPSGVSNANTSGAELAYREYVAGLFVSSRF